MDIAFPFIVKYDFISISFFPNDFRYELPKYAFEYANKIFNWIIQL